jgi:glycosyltransferase involved in cell wall biosynthesis
MGNFPLSLGQPRGFGRRREDEFRAPGAASTNCEPNTVRNSIHCSVFDGRSVTIVMGTYQGERFLPEQLASIAAQSHRNWRLCVSDDGSTDRTRQIIAEFSAMSGNQVVLIDGPRQGFAANFLTAIRRACEADYYAFADQDDIWEPDKLERALSMLERAPTNRPALYCGRTRVVDAAARPIGLSPAFRRPPSFANALVQSIGGANTMVMNHAARELLSAAGVHPDIVCHDWWAYQLVSGAGGHVHYDLEPKLRYRQHDRNLNGANNTLAARTGRARQLFRGRFKAWTDRNIRALSLARHLLTPESQALMEALTDVRDHQFPRNVILLNRSGIYRQTVMDTFGLKVAAAFGKL